MRCLGIGSGSEEAMPVVRSWSRDLLCRAGSDDLVALSLSVPLLPRSSNVAVADAGALR
jgi:hypothetical protein